jgi:hypothetical protein
MRGSAIQHMTFHLRQLPLLLILAVSTVACGDNQSSTALPTQVVSAEIAERELRNTVEPSQTESPVQAVMATRFPATEPRPRATAGPQATPEPTTLAAPDLSLGEDTYVHPSASFSLVPPAGWTIEESDGAASFKAPDGTGFIYVQITNTGYELNDDAFDSFVTHRDRNFFSYTEDYEIVAKDVDGVNGAATITKFLSLDGVAQTVITFYYQYGQIIYSFDFWSDHELFDAYDVLYASVLDTADVDPEAALTQAGYFWVYTFTSPDALFSIKVPTAWQYERSETEDAVVDTFTAPDGHAVIQNVVYDDGDEISRSEAGDLALQLLHSSYASDVRIVDDRLQPDGSERLTWSSSSGGYSGISYFETRGTTFLLFTTMYDNAYEDVYFDTLEYTIGSYVVPTE